jgi:hypothetical protein
MKKFQIFVVIFATILAIITFAIFAALGYIWAGLIAASLVAVGVVGFFLYDTTHTVLTEMEVGVIFDRHGNFVCFLDNVYGRILPRQPNQPIQQPLPADKQSVRHKIGPTEHLTDKITKGFQDTKGTSRGIRTRDGIPVDIPWAVSFRLEVTRILPTLEHKMARVLPKYATNMVGNKASHALQHIVEQHTIYELTEVGALRALEAELREEIFKRTVAFGLTPDCIGPFDVRLGPITLPGELEKALNNAQQRHLHTTMVATALQTLQATVANFREEDMAKLTELERLRILDTKTRSLMLAETFASSNAVKTVNINGHPSGGWVSGGYPPHHSPSGSGPKDDSPDSFY